MGELERSLRRSSPVKIDFWLIPSNLRMSSQLSTLPSRGEPAASSAASSSISRSFYAASCFRNMLHARSRVSSALDRLWLVLNQRVLRAVARTCSYLAP